MTFMPRGGGVKTTYDHCLGFYIKHYNKPETIYYIGRFSTVNFLIRKAYFIYFFPY